MADEMALLRTLLRESELETQDLPDRRAILAEDAMRVVYVVLFETPQALLESWQEEQAWFMELTTRARLSVEKSWDLYMVLASRQSASPLHAPMLDKIRRDVRLTRKLVVPGVGTSDPARISSLLAPLRRLQADPSDYARDALHIVREEATQEGRDDVVRVIDAFRAHEPLLAED